MDAGRIRSLLDSVRRRGRVLLSEAESLDVLRLAGVPVAPMELPPDAEGAAAAAERAGLPVVLTLVSPDLPHKTEAGGVVVGRRPAEQ
ncbi:MAG: acetate--CoA ligase family protein, partial [Acidobacteriota bacterium]